MHHLKPQQGPHKHVITPASAGWQYLGYQVSTLAPKQQQKIATAGNEAALVPLQGSATLSVAGERFEVSRKGVFDEKPQVLYVPPGQEITIEASSLFEFAIGTAPAEGKYPVRLFKPEELRTEVRGGGPAVREVHHILSHPLPAERLILFEVYIPGGMWSGWPPHRHDAINNSGYLEETYHFRFDKPQGFGLHRNYSPETGFDEVFATSYDDVVLVTQGYHPVAASPGSTMYFLNYLAGNLVDNERALPPLDDPDHAWIKDNWDAYDIKLPLME
jgi:5-deoxy-glucuronate isomerase